MGRGGPIAQGGRHPHELIPLFPDESDIDGALEDRVVVYLSPADKYHRLTHRPSQGQKGLDERAIMTSPWSSHPW
jgi:hypothetical protein